MVSPIAIVNTMRLNTKDKSIVNLELCYLFALSRFLQKSLWGAAGFWPRRCFPPSQLQLVVFVFMLTQLVLDHTVCVTFVTELRCTYFFTKSARVAVLSTWAAVAVAIWTYFVCMGQNLIQLERYVLAWYVLAWYVLALLCTCLFQVSSSCCFVYVGVTSKAAQVELETFCRFS